MQPTSDSGAAMVARVGSSVSCLVLVAAVLAGCSSADGTPVIYDGSLVGVARELAEPGATYKAREAADDAKCKRYGFQPGTDGYGNCRLQLDQIRASSRASGSTQQASRSSGGQNLSLLCKDAISRGDSGGTFVHC